MLEQAIIDAVALREASLKNAEALVLEKYAPEVKKTLNALLEQEEDLLGGDPLAGGDLGGLGMDTEQPTNTLTNQIPMAAQDGEKMCPCPDEDEEIEIDFDQLVKQMDGTDQNALQPPGQMGDLPSSDEPIMEEGGVDNGGVMVPATLGTDLHLFHMGMGDPVYKVGSLAIAGKPVPSDLLGDAIGNLEKLSGQLGDPEDEQVLQNLVGQLQQLSSPQTPELGGDPMAEVAPSMFEEELELDEELINSIMETLEVDLNRTPTGHPGGPTQPEEQAVIDTDLARLQDEKQKKELEQNVKAIEDLKLQESRLQKEINNYKKTLSDVQNKVNEKNVENQRLQQLVLESNKKIDKMALDNAKLFYANRTLRNTSLNEQQRQKLVESISKAGSVQEAKMFSDIKIDTTSSGQGKVPSTLNEAISNRGNVFTIRTKTANIESVNPQKERMQQLAGIVKINKEVK